MSEKRNKKGSFSAFHIPFYVKISCKVHSLTFWNHFETELNMLTKVNFVQPQHGLLRENFGIHPISIVFLNSHEKERESNFQQVLRHFKIYGNSILKLSVMKIIGHWFRLAKVKKRQRKSLKSTKIYFELWFLADESTSQRLKVFSLLSLNFEKVENNFSIKRF